MKILDTTEVHSRCLEVIDLVTEASVSMGNMDLILGHDAVNQEPRSCGGGMG